MHYEEIDNAVGTGIDNLDTLVYGWADRVDITFLDMGEWDNCVYGQVFYETPDDEVPARLRRETYFNDQTAVENGFVVPSYMLDDRDAWDQLEALWINAIRERQS